MNASARSDEPYALSVDRCVFTFVILLPLSPAEQQDFLEACALLGNSRVLAGGSHVEIALAAPGEGVDGSSTLLLRQRTVDGGLRLDGTVISNGMRSVRGMYGDGRCGPAGLDGNDNVIGPTESWGHDAFSLTSAAVASSVAEARYCLEQLVPGAAQPYLQSAELRLQKVEFTRDILVTDAVEVAWRVSAACMPGSYYLQRDVYPPRRATSDDRGMPVFRQYETLSGPALKTYAKLPNLLRMEHAFEDREAIKTAGGALTALLGDQGARDLLIQIAPFSIQSLQALESLVRAAAASTASPADLARALRPLLDIGESHGPRRGRPCSAATIAAANEAYNQLLRSGRCMAMGLDKDSPLRRALDALVTDGTLQFQRGRFAMYCLSPTLAGSLAPPVIFASA